MRKSVTRAMLIGTAAMFAAASPAGALTINLINTGGAEEGTLARQGFEAAAGYWSSVFSDDVTINLQVGFGKLGPNILGSTSSNQAEVLVQGVYGALAADSKTAIDGRAVANLKPLSASSIGPFGALDAVTSAYADPATRSGIDTTNTILDNDGGYNNSVLSANTANLKALGYDLGDVVDGSVTFSSDFAFDFRPINGIDAGKTDFLAVAIHEIGHALGFVSGVDVYDVYGDPNSPPLGDPAYPEGFTYSDLLKSGAFGTADIGEFSIFSVFDLFRYSDAGLDWAVGTDARFSIDGGAGLFGDSDLSTGSFNGDGWQASHWKAPTVVVDGETFFSCARPKLGILNPYICSGREGLITGLDLAAFDAMGYDVNFDVSQSPNYSYSTAQIGRDFGVVPEPATWGLMMVGFGFAGSALRRRRSGYATA